MVLFDVVLLKVAVAPEGLLVHDHVYDDAVTVGLKVMVLFVFKSSDAVEANVTDGAEQRSETVIDWSESL